MFIEEWVNINYDTRYQVSNFGRFRKKLKNSYKYLKPFRHHNLFLVKIKDKNFNCARLVANSFIKPLTDKDRVYHKNKIENDNYFRNLQVLSLQDLGKRTGYISNSKPVVEVKNFEIFRYWKSARQASKELFISYQTVNNYCNNKVQNPMFNLMWEDDFFEKEVYKNEKRCYN